jgi:fibronectin-binding autotransporter adhesin
MRRVGPWRKATTLGLLVLAVGLRAQVVNEAWLPGGPDSDFSNPDNWQDGSVPLSDGNARLNLPLASNEVITLPAGSLSLDSLYFVSPSYPGASYRFSSASETTLTIDPNPGSFGQSQTSPALGSPRTLIFDASITVNFATDQSWDASHITFNGAVGGPGRFRHLPLSYYSGGSAEFLNRGHLTLNGPGNFTGGLETSNVTLYLNHPASLAGGPLFLTNSQISAGADYVLNNTIHLAGSFQSYGESLTLSGPITISGNTVISGVIDVSGNIGESDTSALRVSGGVVHLSGTNTYTGGTQVGYEEGIPATLIFENAAAVPDQGHISSDFISYAGVTFTTDIQTGFIDRLSDEGFQGTIGFDSLGATQTFAGPIDLGGLYSIWGIGTSTSAILTGAITTTFDGTGNYLFGGFGGGTLTVASDLSESHDVEVRTPDYTAPTTVIFQGNNSFSDTVLVESGIAIFDGANALPTEVGIELDRTEGSWDIAYAGITENAGLTASQFVNRIAPLATQSVVGFDSANPGAPRTVSETINLNPLLGWRDGEPVYLGTATGVTLAGPILGGAEWLGLTGLKGAQLTVNTVLADAEVGVLRIGLDRSHSVSDTVVLPDEMTGTVRLNGANTFTSGTEWLSGNLVLGHASALGTGTLTIHNDNEDSALTYAGDMTVANAVRFDRGDNVNLGSAASIANLTLTGAITGNSRFDGFNYLGAGTLTYAGTSSEMGWLEINAAPGGSVVYQRADGLSNGTELGSGNLVVAASTDIMYLSTAVGTNVAINTGATLGLFDNNYSEGTLYHEIHGTLSGAGSLRLEENGVVLTGANAAFSGNILLAEGTIGVTQSAGLGTGVITAVAGTTNQIVSLGADLNFTNPVVLQGDLEVSGSNQFGYSEYPAANQDLALSGIISGAGVLRKSSENTLTLAGNNTFTGGIYLERGTMRFTHNNAAGAGTLEFGYNPHEDEVTAVFTTAAPVVGGLASSDDATVQLASGSTLTINQPWDGYYYGVITGSGANVSKTGAGYLRLSGTGLYGYTGVTTISGGGLIFDNHDLVADRAAGSITVGAGAYAGLGYQPESGWTNFLTKINAASTGTVGLDNSRTSTESFSLAGLPGVRLGSSTSGTFLENAVITPAGANYQFGGGGGILTVKSVLTGGYGLDLTSPANQPLSLWLRNNNYFSGAMTVTRSAAVFGPGAINDLSNIALGIGGYVGSADQQLAPAGFLSHIAAGTNQGIVGFDDFNSPGRSVGGEVDLSAFGGGIFLGTSTSATLRGPLILPTGSSTYRFAAYKGGTLVVDTELSGSRSVVIGDLNSFGTMRDPHAEEQMSLVVLARKNYYIGGTTLNAGKLRVGTQGLGSGQLVVATNTFPTADNPVHSLPHLEVVGDGTNLSNGITLNGWLVLGGTEEVTLSGTISGSKGLHVYRFDYLPLTLSGTNTYTGGTILESGNVGLANNAAFGTGAITVYDGGIVTIGGPRTLTAPIHVTSRTAGDTLALRVGGDFALTLNGSINFDSGTAYVGYASSSLPRLPLLHLNGILSGDTRLNFDTGGMVWLAGNNTYSGGTNANHSTRVIFESLAAIPTEGELGGGYIGLATPTASLQADYIDRFGPGYGRTIGFDSIDTEAPQTFAADIDLTGRDHPMLSSATAAILTGNITTDSADFEFTGTGGGILTVASALTGDHGVRLEGSSQPLLVRLTGANTFTGDVVASGTGVTFGTGALPEGVGLVINSSTGGYIGIEDTSISEATFIGQFDPLITHAMIGFDSESTVEPRTVTSPDLSHFTQNPTDIFLGTASWLVIDGEITWPTFNRGMAFAAYRTGWLTVNSELSGGGDVLIGNDRLRWSLQEFEGEFPTVELAGDNSYTGTTEFYGGQLMLSHENALGGSYVRITNPSSSDRPVHRLLLNTPTIGNDIDFDGFNPHLEVAGNLPSTELSGIIAGNGNLTKVGAGTVNLSGANSFSGTVTIAEGIMQFDHATASGSSANTLRFTENGGIAHFTTGNPVVGRLESPRLIDATVDLDAGVNLTVGNHDAGSPGDYMDYYGSFTGAGHLTKEGQGQLRLFRSSSFSGGTTINQGKIVANNASALGTGAITLNGGDLVLGQGVVVNNPISFGGSGGLLSGATTFNGPVSLGAEAGLSPGSSPGTMTFASDLTLGGAAYLDFEIQDVTGLAGSGYDTLVVGNTLYITSSPGSPFIINLISLDGAGNFGSLNLSDSTATYSLLLASAGSISGFAPGNFVLNTSAFSTTLGPSFTFGLLQSGGELRLTFSPVPEPSTYALLCGGSVLLVFLRRRRVG